MYCVPSLHFQGGCSLLGNKKDGNWKNFSCQLVHFFWGGRGVGEGISVSASYIYNVLLARVKDFQLSAIFCRGTTVAHNLLLNFV
jgi:hypothetical protein